MRDMENYRLNHKDWRRRNPENLKKSNDKYYLKHSEEIKANIRQYRKNNPEKVKAHNILNHALQRGEILREPCVICGKPAHLHHPDYSKPLEGIWLCAIHHHGGHCGAKEVLVRFKALGITF